MDKKGDPTYIRLRLSTKKRVQVLAQQFGDISESEVIDWLTTLGLDTYEFHLKHFSVFPVGLNFTPSKNGKEGD